jgi:hypothetical protein
MRSKMGRALLRMGLLLALVGILYVGAFAEGGGISPTPGTQIQRR